MFEVRTVTGETVIVKGEIKVDPQYCLHEFGPTWLTDGGLGIAARCRICNTKVEAEIPHNYFIPKQDD